MMLKLIPLILLLLGTGAGIGAGIFLAPSGGTDGHEVVEPVAETDDEQPGSGTEFVKLNNQFVVPVIEDERVVSLVVMSLSVETSIAMSDAIYEREPRLRDQFLRVMFDHANMGGFHGAFTQSRLKPNHAGGRYPRSPGFPC